MEVWRAIIDVTGWGLAVFIAILIPSVIVGLIVGVAGSLKEAVEDWWERRRRRGSKIKRTPEQW